MVERDSFRAGSYSGFGVFREKLAEMGGIILDRMQGYTENGISWTGDEDFYELLNHSDCDGELYPSECEELIADFEKYREEWTHKIKIEGLSPYTQDKYDKWLDFLRRCVEEDGVLHFG